MLHMLVIGFAFAITVFLTIFFIMFFLAMGDGVESDLKSTVTAISVLYLIWIGVHFAYAMSYNVISRITGGFVVSVVHKADFEEFDEQEEVNDATSAVIVIDTDDIQEENHEV